MQQHKSEQKILAALCRKAREAELAIGQWWFGPRPGSFYVLDAQTGEILAGASGMTLVQLTAWFWRLEMLPTTLTERRVSRAAAAETLGATA